MNPPDAFAASDKFDALVRHCQENLTIPWLVTTASIGLDSIILSFVADNGPAPASLGLTIVFAAVGCGLAAASFLIPRRACSDAAISAQMRREPLARSWADRMSLDGDQFHALMGLPKPLQRLIGLIATYRTPYLMAIGASVSVASVGFVYGLITKSMLYALPWLAAAFALNGLHYPRFAKLVARGRKLDQPDEEDLELERKLKDMKRVRKATPGPAAAAPEGARVSRASNRPPPRPTKP